MGLHWIELSTRIPHLACLLGLYATASRPRIKPYILLQPVAPTKIYGIGRGSGSDLEGTCHNLLLGVIRVVRAHPAESLNLAIIDDLDGPAKTIHPSQLKSRRLRVPLEPLLLR